MKEAGNNSYQSILVDKEACIGCINCIKRCPTKAIRVMDGKAQIDSSKCINCGDCVMVCQKRAMHPNFDGIDIINNFKYKVALPASSFFGQFRNADDVDKILNSLLYIGFDDVFEAARGDDVLSGIVKKALAEGKLAKPLISAACPACVELILMCFHNLKNNLVPFVPASHIAAKLAREEAVRKTGLAPEDIGVFFISPCPAHASAIKTDLYKSGCKIDGVLSVREVSLKVMNLKFDGVEVKTRFKAGTTGIRCAVTGGEVKNVGSSRALAVDGMENVISVLKELEDGKHPELEYVELNACPSGCVGGAMNLENAFFAKSTIMKLRREVVKERENTTDKADKPLDFYIRPEPWQVNNAYYQLDEDFTQAFIKMRKLEEVRQQLPGLDCGICGAPSCKAFAEDVAKGRVSITRCIKFGNIDKKGGGAMTVSEMIEKLGLEVFNLSDGGAVIEDYCASDLFSYVISKVKEKCCWLTIMSNVNITAVAKLSEMSAVVLCDGVRPDENLTNKARQQEITILGSKLPIFETCVALSKII